MSNYQLIINSNIRRLRKSTGLTQDKFAEKVGVSSDTIGNLENNKYAPTPETIDKICEAFGISPFDLLLPRLSEGDIQRIDIVIKKLKLCSENQLLLIDEMIDLIRKRSL